MTRVVFALERNASTDPPDDDTPRITNLGIAYYIHGDWWERLDGGSYSVVFPEWWLDVRPSDEPLTTDDLIWAVGAVDDLTREHEDDRLNQASQEYARQGREVSARLRAALDALTRKEEP